MRIQIINGPNINLLGKREPSIYGSVTFEDYLAELREKYADVQIDYFQSNIEGRKTCLRNAFNFRAKHIGQMQIIKHSHLLPV